MRDIDTVAQREAGNPPTSHFGVGLTAWVRGKWCMNKSQTSGCSPNYLRDLTYPVRSWSQLAILTGLDEGEGQSVPSHVD